MSYDIRLIDEDTKKPLHSAQRHLIGGGTYVAGGTTELWLNVTYNYAPFFESLGNDGIRTIYGMTGADSIPVLQQAADALSGDADDDYWAATEGNAKVALLQLTELAKMAPDGVWDGD